MDESLHSDENIIKYLDHEMERDEKQHFESQLQKDSLLQERVMNLRITLEAIRQAGTSDKIKNIHSHMMAEMMPAKKTAAVRPLFKRVLAVAAVVLFMVAGVGGWWAYQLSSEKVFQDNYTDFSISTTRGGNDSATAVSTLYQQRKWNEVIEASKQITPAEHDKLLIALSHLHTNNLDESISIFEEIVKENSAYKQDAEYYLAMTYLKIKDFDKALNLMEAIHENKNHLYNNQITTGLIRDVKILRWK